MFQFNPEENEKFRQYTRELIAGQVRSILRGELSGIVHAEIAKLRLLQPGSPTLNELVTKHVNAQIQHAIARVKPDAQSMVRDELRQIIKQTIDPITADITKAVRRQMVATLQELT